MEITIRIFNPTPDVENFATDVYINGERISLGAGGQTKEQAIRETGDWLKIMAAGLAAGER